METAKTKMILPILSAILIVSAIILHYADSPWGYYWKVPSREEALRNALVGQAESYLGLQEADGSHMAIISRYNSQSVLPVDYTLQPTDSWCAAFVTVAALEQGLTDIIPAECGCQRQIELFQTMGRWVESDTAIPLPGDIIYYDWDETSLWKDATGWSDHVGIVVGTKWPFIKVIEGNKDDCVSYRILPIGHRQIRGYGMPDYAGKNIP